MYTIHDFVLLFCCCTIHNVTCEHLLSFVHTHSHTHTHTLTHTHTYTHHLQTPSAGHKRHGSGAVSCQQGHNQGLSSQLPQQWTFGPALHQLSPPPQQTSNPCQVCIIHYHFIHAYIYTYMYNIIIFSV